MISYACLGVPSGYRTKLPLLLLLAQMLPLLPKVVNQLALRLEPDKLDRDIELVVLEPLFKLAFELLLDM